MKCGIITFHRAINYGGVLQALALQTVIEGLDVDAEVIDYYAPSIEDLYRPSFKNRFKKSNLKRYAAALLKNGNLVFNNKGFADFRAKHLRTSKTAYFNAAQLAQANYDVFITGSDQVWSPSCASFDDNYFLNFVKDSSKKNSYAASFGVNEIPDALAPRYRDLLRDFNHISVRESDGSTIVRNLLNKDVPVVLDPTLLLNKDQWSAYLPDTPPANEKYILLYMIAEDEELISKAIALAKQKNLKVYYINDRLYKAKGVKNLRKVNPDRWLQLFMNAEYVFTNSFHGVAFSINFERKFFVQKLKSNVKVNSRINNILKVFGLEARQDYASVEQEIDYTNVNQTLSQEREKCILFLKRIFSGDR